MHLNYKIRIVNELELINIPKLINIIINNE